MYFSDRLRIHKVNEVYHNQVFTHNILFRCLFFFAKKKEPQNLLVTKLNKTGWGFFLFVRRRGESRIRVHDARIRMIFADTAHFLADVFVLDRQRKRVHHKHFVLDVFFVHKAFDHFVHARLIHIQRIFACVRKRTVTFVAKPLMSFHIPSLLAVE
jgi:hypothetical protein